MEDIRTQTRRRFMTSAASGLGTAALASLLQDDGVIADDQRDPLAPKEPHYPAKTKACIFILHTSMDLTIRKCLSIMPLLVF